MFSFIQESAVECSQLSEQLEQAQNALASRRKMSSLSVEEAKNLLAAEQKAWVFGEKCAKWPKNSA